MTVTATYNATGGYVSVAVTSAPSNAATVLIERSTDQVAWTTVRGTTPPVALSGGAFTVSDYEFNDAVLNYYRATYYDTTTPAPAGAPAAATVTTSAGVSASVTPTMPTGLSTGDVVFVIIANTKATATLPAAPAGWMQLATDTDGLGVYCADWSASLTIPAFTVTGLASGDKVIGKCPYALRNVAPTLGNAGSQVNAASTNIAYPAFTSTGGTANAGQLILFSRTINTGVSPTVSTNDTAAGYTLLTDALIPASIAASSFTLTGSSSATSSVLWVNMGVRLFVSQDTGTVTPSLGSTVWIKFPTRPYLNVQVVTVAVDDITHKSRSGTFDIIGRTMPIAVTDLFSGRDTTLTVRALDRTSTDAIENSVMVGDVVFVHAPKGAVTPTGYFATGDTVRSRPAQSGTVRYLKIPITETAAPSPVLAAVQSTWQTVISDYATWSAVIAAKATWNDVLQLVGSASDVITG